MSPQPRRVTNPKLEADLRSARKHIERYEDHVANVKAARDDMIRRALVDGWTHAQIAEAAGVTRGRVNQIAQRR